jgi:dihydroorotate dehydrogenase
MSSFKTMDEAVAFLDTLQWGNAAGFCREVGLAKHLVETGVTAVNFGSITMEPRAGNIGGDFYYQTNTGWSVNALGMPNRGFREYLPELVELRRWMVARNKKEGCRTSLWVSISSGNQLNVDEIYTMASDLQSRVASDVVELNSACPNLETGGKRKPIVCYDAEAFRISVMAAKFGAGVLPLAVKISPITEAGLLQKLVDICLEQGVKYLVVANTEPNCYLEKRDGTRALPGMIRGGMGGRYLRPKVEAMIQMIRPWIENTSLRLIAVGGIETGTDACRYLRIGGASVAGFQFNTCLYRESLQSRPDYARVVERMTMGWR